jgi:hypothetical protein
MSPAHTLRALAVIATALLATAPAALAGNPKTLNSPLLPGVAPQLYPTTTSTLLASSAVNTTCIDTLRSGASVTRHTFTAPADGSLYARMKGTSTTDDWDLALFTADGRRLAGSGAFFTNEVVQGTLRAGDKVVIQACRLKGRDSTQPLETTFVGHPVTEDATTGKIKLLKVRVLDRREYHRLEAFAHTTGLVDITHDVQDGRAMVIAYSPEMVDKLRAAGFILEVADGDMLATDRAARERDRANTARQGEAGSQLPSGRTEYRVIEDYYTELKKLVDENPGLVRPIALKGRSAEGRELVAVEIAHKVRRPAEGRPYFLLNGVHHAREWPAAETPMEFAIDLVKSYKAGDPRVRRILKRTRVIAQPMTNVDGYNNSRSAPVDPDPSGSGLGGLYNASGLSPGPGANAYRRKNCNYPYPQPVPCEMQLGVDPNRNYPESWGGPGASSNPHSQTFRGPGPGSEPEVTTVRELVSQFQVTSLVALHNVAALVLRPPGLEVEGFAPDEDGLKALGDKMADATGYTSQYGWELYDTTGTTDDWSYAATGGYGYTIEIGPAGGEFHSDYKIGVIDQYLGDPDLGLSGKGLREAFLLAAEHASDPTASGRIVGRAPAGRQLRLKKEFETASSAVCANAETTPVTGGDEQPDYCTQPGEVQLTDEKIETVITVPPSGRFTYWVNPSTRPFVKRADKTELWTLTCEDNGKVLERDDILIDRGQVVRRNLACGGKKAKPKSKLQKCRAKAAKKKGAARRKALKACKRKYGRKKR